MRAMLLPNLKEISSQNPKDFQNVVSGGRRISCIPRGCDGRDSKEASGRVYSGKATTKSQKNRFKGNNLGQPRVAGIVDEKVEKDEGALVEI